MFQKEMQGLFHRRSGIPHNALVTYQFPIKITGDDVFSNETITTSTREEKNR
jgi:hypothetical protein